MKHLAPASGDSEEHLSLGPDVQVGGFVCPSPRGARRASSRASWKNDVHHVTEVQRSILSFPSAAQLWSGTAHS